MTGFFKPEIYPKECVNMMKYCPYCGAALADGAASFYMERKFLKPVALPGKQSRRHSSTVSQRKALQTPRKRKADPGEHLPGVHT